MTKILGKPTVTAQQMAQYLLSKNASPKFTRNISVVDFCQLFLDICAKEGVRGDIAFAQSCKETGNFKFTGIVSYTQNNFSGLGATGGSEKGCVFETIEIGILAQAQHLKTYATKDKLNEKCVDPRRTNWFVNTKGGTSPDVETLGGSWAVPGYDTKKYASLEAANKAKDSYGYQIMTILNNIAKVVVKEEKEMGYLIAVEAGHGSETAGKRTVDGYREHWINVKCANYYEIGLKRCGFRTVRIAWDDTIATDDADIALATRQSQIKKAGADASVSWHANAHGDGKTWTTGQGIETFIHSYSSKVGDSLAFANAVQAELIKGTAQKNRGVKKDNFAMCNTVAMGTRASILIEIGFMTNEYEASLMKTDAFCQECAEEAVKGTCAYFGVAYKKPSTTVSKTDKLDQYKIEQDKKAIQHYLNNFYGEEIKKVTGALLEEDGKIGTKSKLALGVAFQVEINKLGANIKVDGKIGEETVIAFNEHVCCLRKGSSKKVLHTLWQCVLVANGLDPKGIDGKFGSGCAAATNELFTKLGLLKDAIVNGCDLNAVL